jgi:peptidoglycan/LPS O-acetylase OafA/YrhL
MTAAAPAIAIVPARATSRIVELDGLRAFAILPVLLHHSWPAGHWTSSVADAGWMGVDLFFVLSGYLITGILLRSGSYRNFLARRALRIFPLYYLCLALFTLVAVFRTDQASWEAMKSWGGAGWFFVYLGNFRAAWINSLPPVLSFATLWSLQVEEQFYLLFPIAVAFLSRPNLRRFLIGCAIAAPILRLSLVLFAPHNLIAGAVLMPCRMDALALGGLVALSDRPFPRAAFAIGAAVLAAILFLRGASGYDSVMRSIGYSAVDLTCACLLSWVLRSRGSRSTGILRLRPLVYTGQIAYGLYLLHEPASWAARRVLGNIEAHAPLSVPITFGASFLAAGLSWRFFESPFLALKKNFQMRE